MLWLVVFYWEYDKNVKLVICFDWILSFVRRTVQVLENLVIILPSVFMIFLFLCRFWWNLFQRATLDEYRTSISFYAIVHRFLWMVIRYLSTHMHWLFSLDSWDDLLRLFSVNTSIALHNRVNFTFFQFITRRKFVFCFSRRKHSVVIDDNCCRCNLSGVKYLSKLSEDDILFASFKNHLCEVTYCTIVYLCETIYLFSLVFP